MQILGGGPSSCHDQICCVVPGSSRLRQFQLRWTPHPVIVTMRNSKDYIRVLLYSYYTTITGWGVLLSSNLQAMCLESKPQMQILRSYNAQSWRCQQPEEVTQGRRGCYLDPAAHAFVCQLPGPTYATSSACDTKA